MTRGTLAILGGSGLDQLDGFELTTYRSIETPYGTPSAPLGFGRFAGRDLVFLPRHGPEHHLPPHRINYRANLWALREVGVGEIFAVAAVGGIAPDLAPGSLVVPDQIIDYTWGRAMTFHEPPSDVVHIDFTYPYTSATRATLIEGARRAEVTVVPSGVYGATQGPRLESAAEIDRMERDGCTIVGMTGMPEAGLAREAGLDYAVLALVVNPAAGRAPGEISMQAIEAVFRSGIAVVREVLAAAVSVPR